MYRVMILKKIAKSNTREIWETRRLKSRNLLLYSFNKIIKFKLLFYYCYSNMSCVMFRSFLFDFVHASVIFHCIALAVRTVLCRYRVFRLWNTLCLVMFSLFCLLSGFTMTIILIMLLQGRRRIAKNREI